MVATSAEKAVGAIKNNDLSAKDEQIEAVRVKEADATTESKEARNPQILEILGGANK